MKINTLGANLTGSDMFCGAGGTSCGASNYVTIKWALNHWDKAIEVHNANQPEADHFLGDVKHCKPWTVGRTTILFGSPACTDFSQAKIHEIPESVLKQYSMFDANSQAVEAAIAERQTRATMWNIVEFAEYHRYELIILENVAEVRRWGDYNGWLKSITNLGYNHKTLYLNSQFFHNLNGSFNSPIVPQSRDRWYTVFWRKGNKTPDLTFTPLAPCPTHGDIQAVQSWKNPGKQFGKYKAQYVYRCPTCAAEVTPYFYPAIHAIDFTLPIVQIKDKKTVSLKTIERIRDGLKRFGNQPILIDQSHGGHHRSALLSPLYTQTTSQTQTITIPPAFLTEMYGNGKAREITRPLNTITAGGGKTVLVQPFVVTYNGTSITKPVSTEALSTVTTIERHGLTIPAGFEPEDCYYRTLRATPELKAGMGFPKDYILADDSKTNTRLLGGAVTPVVMEWIVGRAVATLQ